MDHASHQHPLIKGGKAESFEMKRVMGNQIQLRFSRKKTKEGKKGFNLHGEREREIKKRKFP